MLSLNLSKLQALNGAAEEDSSAGIPRITDIIRNAQSLAGIGSSEQSRLEVNGKKVVPDTTLYELFVYLKMVEEEGGGKEKVGISF